MKDWEHPAISRGKTFWSYEVGLLGFLAVLFVVAALENQSNELWLFAAGAAVLTILSVLFARWQIQKLRHEYRYEDDADDGPDQQ